MQPVSHVASRYDGITITLHWFLALLVVEQWLGAHFIDYFPCGPLRINARSVHITFGATLAIILLGRLYWRACSGRRLLLADTGWLNAVAKATHWGLYALLAAIVLVGLFLTWTRSNSLFKLGSVPAYGPGYKDLPDTIQEIHAIIGYLILGLAGLYTVAALAHRFIWYDGALGRMLPGQQRCA